jgi:hypothetical protein
MVTIALELSDELAQQCSLADGAHEGAPPHGSITVASLLSMLADDAGMIMRLSRIMRGRQHGGGPAISRLRILASRPVDEPLWNTIRVERR